MKKLTILAVLVTFISAASFASEKELGGTSKFQIIAKSDLKYDLYYASEKEGNVSVAIYDAGGKKIYSNVIRKAKNFKQTYNFSKLSPGKYNVVLKNDNGIANEQIDHKLRTSTLKTFVSKLPEGKSLKLHVGNFNFNKAIKVSIYDQNERLVHQEKITNEEGFSRVYNLEKTTAKSVRVSIGNDGELQSFSHSFR